MTMPRMNLTTATLQAAHEQFTPEEISHMALERVLEELQGSLEILAKSIRLQNQACQKVGNLNKIAEHSPQTVGVVDDAIQGLLIQSLLEDSHGPTRSSHSDHLGWNSNQS